VEAAEQAEKRGDWIEAEVRWKAMRTAFPHIWYSYAGGAAALWGQDRHDEARQMLEEAAARFPEERAIPLSLGRMTAHLADWPAAEAHWRTALTFDVRPWWVFTELAGALEHQDRLVEAEAVLLDAQVRADEPDEITLFTYPARLAWLRQDWATAVARWAEARRRFPEAIELPDREHEALMRLAEHDSAAYEAALRDLKREAPDEHKRALALRFESVGGTGPDGGCEFGCFQRAQGAEPLGLFRWATVSPAQLIACLDSRFARLGDAGTVTISPHDGQWEITDTAYGTKMHSFVPTHDVPHDKMLALVSKRMGYLKGKLIADLESPAKILVFKSGWVPVTEAEIEALSRAIRSYGEGELLCVCAADPAHPEGTIVPAALGVFVGYIDFSGRPRVGERQPTWEALCRTMLGMSKLEPIGDPADEPSPGSAETSASPLGPEQVAAADSSMG
jgi:tetratricopeptide (TPR) repeat protein